MGPSLPVRIVDSKGNLINAGNPLFVTSVAGGAEGGASDVNVTNASLAVADPSSAFIRTAVELIDNAIAGTEMQVDVVAPLPAGTNNIGDVDIASIARPTVLRHGQTAVATAGTAVVLGGDLALLSGVTIRAGSANVGVVYIGAVGVTSANGIILAAGDHVFLDIANVNLVYVNAATNGDSVSWIGS